MGEDESADEEENKPRLPQLTPLGIGLSIIFFVTLLAFNVQFASNSIESLLETTGFTPEFLGVIILPFLNIDPTIFVLARRDKMDLSLALTIGKCIQTALAVVPLTIIIAWGMGVEEMTLLFSGFEVAATFAAVLVVCHIIDGGTSDWLQGALLIQGFLVIAVASFFVPPT